MNNPDGNIANAPDSVDDAIEAQLFVPSESVTKDPRIALWQIVLLLLATVAIAVFWFLFTSKSVLLDFSPSATVVDVQGGISFELGGIYLLRQGEYKISAQAPLHEPLQETIQVGDERNQRIPLAFTPLPGFLTFSLDPQRCPGCNQHATDGYSGSHSTSCGAASGDRFTPQISFV